MTQPTIKARPTVYNGIKMRSRLEAGFAAWLDQNQFDWEYEPCAFASEDGQYLPDFRLNNVFATWSPKPVTFYVEIKPKHYARSVRELGTCTCPFDDNNLRKAHEQFCGDQDDRARSEHLHIAAQDQIIAASEPDARLLLIQPKLFPRMLFRSDEGFSALGAVRFIALPEGRVGFENFERHVSWPWPEGFWSAS
jgi:hypothetical protein